MIRTNLQSLKIITIRKSLLLIFTRGRGEDGYIESIKNSQLVAQKMVFIFDMYTMFGR